MSDDLISRRAAVSRISDLLMIELKGRRLPTWNEVYRAINDLPSAQPEDWMERNKERILQAGMEGREIEFRIGGRLFAIREKAQ